MEAKVASSATIKATSTAAGTLEAAPRSSNAAMPPVPISCAAIMRSASLGPWRTRTSPSASMARMNASEAVRNSVMTEHPGERRFLGDELRYHRLIDIEAVVDELSPVASGGHRAGQQACERGEGVVGRSRWKADRIGHEARAQRQPRIEHAPRDVHSGDYGLVEESESKQGQRERRRKPTTGGQQVQAGPRRGNHRDRAGRKVEQAGACKHQPECEEQSRSPERAPRQGSVNCVRCRA